MAYSEADVYKIDSFCIWHSIVDKEACSIMVIYVTSYRQVAQKINAYQKLNGLLPSCENRNYQVNNNDAKIYELDQGEASNNLSYPYFLVQSVLIACSYIREC